MKSAIFATAFALTIAAVSAQNGFNIADIPPCASGCAISSIGSTGCAVTDFACICKNTTFIDALKPCVVGTCDSNDQQTIVSMASGLCAGYGVAIPSDILSSSVSGAPTPSPTNGTLGTPSPTHSTSTSTGAAAHITGSSFVVAVMGAAMLVL